jgi:ribosomal protein S19
LGGGAIDAIEKVRDYVERDPARKVVERWSRRTVVEPAMARPIEMLGDGAASMR